MFILVKGARSFHLLHICNHYILHSYQLLGNIQMHQVKLYIETHYNHLPINVNNAITRCQKVCCTLEK